MKSLAVVHIGPGKAEPREISLETLGSKEVLIQTLCSAISPGTESMIYRGHMPREIDGDVSIRNLDGRLEYPFSYGYTLSGKITECGKEVDSSWIGRSVFVFHPHQDQVIVPVVECLPIPADLNHYDALFLPNMESALNFVMDANPVIGSRVMVFGLGIVGLLTCELLSRQGPDRLIGLDPLADRRQRALNSSLCDVADPSDTGQWQSLINELFNNSNAQGVDIVFELSGNMQALNQAIEATGFDGTILLGSWYGTHSHALDLGGHFHRRRINIVSSQVSTLSPSLSGRWNKQRRIALAWDMIRAIRPASLITHRFQLQDCDRAFEVASQRLENCLQVIFEYS